MSASVPINTAVDLGGIALRNPVLTASGTFGYGVEHEELLDLSRLDELRGVSYDGYEVAIGAMTSKRTVERSELVKSRQPLLHAATLLVAHPQIRNRGTLGGSLAHADPAAELPVVAVARVIALRPSILLMDEPYSAVDPLVRARLQDDLLALNEHYALKEIFLRADKKAPYGVVVKAMAAARAAGSNKLGIVTEADFLRLTVRLLA